MVLSATGDGSLGHRRWLLRPPGRFFRSSPSRPSPTRWRSGRRVGGRAAWSKLLLGPTHQTSVVPAEAGISSSRTAFRSDLDIGDWWRGNMSRFRVITRNPDGFPETSERSRHRRTLNLYAELLIRDATARWSSLSRPLPAMLSIRLRHGGVVTVLSETIQALSVSEASPAVVGLDEKCQWRPLPWSS